MEGGQQLLFQSNVELHWTLKWCSGKGLNPSCVFNPWFAAFCIQQYSREEPVAYQLHLWPPAPPVATCPCPGWHRPRCTSRLYTWNEGNPGHTAASAHAGTRMHAVRSSIPLLHGTLLGVCLVRCNPSTEQESQHTTTPRTSKLRKAKQIKRAQEAERIRQQKSKLLISTFENPLMIIPNHFKSIPISKPIPLHPFLPF